MCVQESLMEPPNHMWGEILQQASANQAMLQQPEVVRNIQTILATNVSACSSLGNPFVSQLTRIYRDMLSLYGWAAPCWPLSLQCHSESVLRVSCPVCSRADGHDSDD